MSETYYQRLEREAIERLTALLALRMPAFREEAGSEGVFDPWDIFPVYGSYSSDFDECALDVLRELRDRAKVRDDLGAEMFREMLCKQELCNYGTSPRVCFPSERFRHLLPEFIEKWQAYAELQWGSDFPTPTET